MARRMTVLLGLLAIAVTAVADTDPLRLAREVIASENARLTKEAQDTRALMAIADMTLSGYERCRHAVARAEATVVMYNAILKRADAELLVVTARAIVEGSLERLSGELIAHERKPAETPESARRFLDSVRKQEQQLADELAALQGWRDKVVPPDGK